MLKKTITPDPNHRSFHYKKQPTFKGSNREIRGKILRLKIIQPAISVLELSSRIQESPEKIQEIITKMEQEGFFKKTGKKKGQ
jgi:A/G-specific adenine glycosylase